MFPPKLFTHAYRSSGLGERVTGQLSDISGARFWAEEIGGQNWKVWCIKMRATPSSFSLPGGSLCVCTGLHSITPAVKKWSRVARLIAGSDLKFARDARFVIVRSSLRERGLIQTLPRFVRDSIRFPLRLDRVAAFPSVITLIFAPSSREENINHDSCVCTRAQVKKEFLRLPYSGKRVSLDLFVRIFLFFFLSKKVILFRFFDRCLAAYLSIYCSYLNFTSWSRSS